jgi:hypothetical protein
MAFLEIIFAFLIAFILAGLLGGFLGWERPVQPGLWPSLLFLFFIIFFASWAGGVWLRPIGPAIGGVYWLSFVVVGLITAFLLAVAVMPRPRQERLNAERKPRPETEARAALGTFFWILMIAFVVAIAFHYTA